MSGDWFEKRRSFNRESPFDDLMEELRQIRFAIESNDHHQTSQELQRTLDETRAAIVEMSAIGAQGIVNRGSKLVTFFLVLISILLIVLILK
jgi:hypothetical protein